MGGAHVVTVHCVVLCDTKFHYCEGQVIALIFIPYTIIM